MPHFANPKGIGIHLEGFQLIQDVYLEFLKDGIEEAAVNEGTEYRETS